MANTSEEQEIRYIIVSYNTNMTGDIGWCSGNQTFTSMNSFVHFCQERQPILITHVNIVYKK